MSHDREPVLLTNDVNGIRTLTLNRPDRKNAIDAQLWVELADALRGAARDRDLRALALHELTMPTIAKVASVAVGAGWNLALGCDFVVATPESRFCQIFSKRGLSVDLGWSWLLPKLGGLQQAKRLVEARAQPGNFATADSKEAYAAFAEKRSPTFTGRWAVSAHARTTQRPRSENKDA